MIHIYTQFNNNILLDIESGAVHVIDDISKYILEQVGEEGPMPETPDDSFNYGNYTEEEIQESWKELYALQEKGQLYTENVYKIDDFQLQESVIKSLCLHISHDCNLRCDYCFASTGDFGTGRRLNMPFSVAQKAIDFVIEKSGKRRNIEIDFFGGEPLLGFDVVKKTVEYARSKEKEYNKNFRFTITTNGVLLDEDKIKWINDNMKNVVLSLDGRKEVNDRFRHTVNGKGSYDLIINNFKTLVKERDNDKDYYVRGTYTKFNLDFLEDIKSISNEGFYHLSVEPVSADKEKEYALTEEDIPTIYQEYDKLAEYMLNHEGEFNFFHFNIDLSQGPCVIKRIRGCGAGSEYVAITPDGDIYPCHQFVGQEDYYLGNIFKKDFNTSLSDKFRNTNLTTRNKCQSCWAKYYCSGGCSAANYFTNGDINEPAELQCALERKRVECAIALKIAKLTK